MWKSDYFALLPEPYSGSLLTREYNPSYLALFTRPSIPYLILYALVALNFVHHFSHTILSSMSCSCAHSSLPTVSSTSFFTGLLLLFQDSGQLQEASSDSRAECSVTFHAFLLHELYNQLLHWKYNPPLECEFLKRLKLLIFVSLA